MNFDELIGKLREIFDKAIDENIANHNINQKLHVLFVEFTNQANKLNDSLSINPNTKEEEFATIYSQAVVAINLNAFLETYYHHNESYGPQSRALNIYNFIVDNYPYQEISTYRQIMIFLEQIFIDEENHEIVETTTLDFILSNLGSIDNPSSILGHEYLLHLENIDNFSLLYDNFDLSDIYLSDQESDSEETESEINPFESLCETWFDQLPLIAIMGVVAASFP